MARGLLRLTRDHGAFGTAGTLFRSEDIEAPEEAVRSGLFSWYRDEGYEDTSGHGDSERAVRRNPRGIASPERETR